MLFRAEENLIGPISGDDLEVLPAGHRVVVTAACVRAAVSLIIVGRYPEGAISISCRSFLLDRDAEFSPCFPLDLCKKLESVGYHGLRGV